MTTIRVISPVIDTAPGEIAVGQVEIVNEASTPTTYVVRVVGTGSEATATPFEVRVDGGQSATCRIPMQIAPTLGIGRHAAAFEVSSDRPDEQALLSPFTVSIASVERVALTATPATIRARRRATFHVDVANNEANPVALELTGTAADVVVEFTPDRFDLAPGQRAISTGKIKGPRHWSGEPTQHNLLVSAHGRAATTSITAPYIQRPLFAHRLRMVIAAVTVIALWLGAIGGVALWWSNRDDATADAATKIVAVDTDGDGVPDAFFDVDGNPIGAVDTNGDGIPDTFTDAQGNPITNTDTDGDGVADTFVDANGNPIRGADTDGDGVVDTFVDANGNPISGPNAGDDEAATGAPRPTSTIVRGTVSADGDVQDVQVAIAPIALGTPPDPLATPVGFANPDRDAPAKIWSARYARVDTGLSQRRITQAVPPLTTTPQADGIWLFGDVALGQSYEIVFSKPGFDTQSFVITPPDDGSPIDIDVRLESARGSLSGRVLGPNGGLGGAEVTVTDGTLTFTTTSATDGDTGAWSLEAVSTPGVYTVTSTLRGYGTQVLQVDLSAGQNRTGADLVMERGVGTISGQILDEVGDPLGGVTITATNGDVSQTTTSLTEGDIGFYSVPQLALAGPYTLTVELDGYVTQTRRVTLNGSLADVDFDLVGSSLNLTGLVTSADGVGIESAGVTLSTGDLQFRVQTTSAPDRGAFRVEDLPPGLYTVSFDHFEHFPATEFITLQAGVPPDPLVVSLEPSDGPPNIGTGSLRVEVVDRNTTAGSTVKREVNDATVTVIDFTSGEQVAQETQESNNFRFENLAIGTYRVSVAAPFYNDSPDRLVTIGLSEEFEEFELVRLGAASGKLIDPTDATKKFVSVAVSLYLEPRSPRDSPFVVTRTDENSLWQTLPDALVTGTYSVEVDSNAAGLRGFVVRDDQVLDPDVTGPDPEMKFVIPNDAVEPIEVDDIEADPYPNISGVVYKPILNRTFDPARTDLVAIDSAGLAVTMECPGATPTPATITDEQTTIGGGLNDTFRISKELVDANDLIGDCTLTYEATGFEPLTLPLDDVDAGTGTVAIDRQLNAALTAPAPDIRGTVYWTDPGAPVSNRQIFLDGVQVATTRTTGFGPGVGVSLPTQLSDATTTTSATTTEGAGRWALPGQVFGEADYSFTAANFDPAVVTITIDENGLQLPLVTDSNVTVSGDVATGFAVELEQPADGTISGSIAIESSRAQTAADFENITITATAPGGDTVTETGPTPAAGQPVITRPTPSTFRIDNAGAGTWTIDFAEPNNYDFFALGLPQLRPQVPPGGSVTGANTELVELATLELTLVGTPTPSDSAPPITAAPTITLTPSALSVPGAVPVPATTLPAKPGGPTNTFVKDNIAVASNNPSVQPVLYELDLELTGYDTTAAQDLLVDFRAGQVVPRTIVLPSLGSVSGTIEGRLDPSNPATVEDRPIDGTTTRVTVTPLVGPGGAPSGPAFTPTVTGNTYSFSGQAGWFRIDVASVGFTPESRDVQIVNDVDDTQNFALAIVPGSIDLTVVSDLVGRTAVTGAEYDLTAGACAPPVGIESPDGLIDDGTMANNTLVTGLTPGAYCLAIRQYTTAFDPLNPSAPRAEAAFPAIATITVGRSTTPLPTTPAAHAPVGATTTVTAPLPAILPSVTGTIRAVNKLGDPVALPPTVGLRIDYAGTVLEVDNEPGGDTANLETRSDTITVTTSSASTAVYRFDRVPVGSHVITPQADIAGYTPKATTVPVTVGDGGTSFGPSPAGDIVYEVENVTVVVTLVPPASAPPFGSEETFDFAPGDVSLQSPATSTTPETYNPVFNRSTLTLTFSNVAPEIGNFRLNISDPLHTYPGSPVLLTVPVVTTSPFVQNEDVVATPALGRVTGAIDQYETNTARVDLAAGAEIELRNTDTNTVVQTITTTEATATYEFLATTGNYEVSITLDGYTEPAVPVVITNGRVTTRDIRIDKLATITVTIGNTTVPTGTEVVLVANDSTSTEIALVQSGNTFTRTVVAGTYRYLEARAPGYRTQRNPSTANPVLPLSIGVPLTRSFTLASRSLTVNPVDQATSTAITNATVRVDFGAFTTTSPSPGPHVFNSIDADPANPPAAIPVTGTGTATVSAPTKRTRTAPIGDLTSETIQVRLFSLFTATGSITAPDASVGDRFIWAEAPGQTTVYGSITSNTYSIPALANNLTTGAPIDWTIKYDRPGDGKGQLDPWRVAADSDTPPANTTITVTPQQIPVTFTVKSSETNAGMAGATVTLGGVPSSDTAPDGTITIDVAEDANEAARTWTASKAGFVTSPAQTLPAFTNRNPVPAGAATEVTLASRSLTLTVLAADGDPSNNTQISWTCPAGVTCPSSTSTGATSNTYTFVAPVTAGTYTINASKGGESGTATVTVAATGGIGVLSPTTLTLA